MTRHRRDAAPAVVLSRPTRELFRRRIRATRPNNDINVGEIRMLLRSVPELDVRKM